MYQRALRFHVIVILCVAAGCSKPSLPGPKPYPARGGVTYQRKPARNFRVAFYPLNVQWKLQFAPSAVTDENGEFHLRSYALNDGAPAGEYAVIVTWPQHLNTPDDLGAGPEEDRLEGRYSDPKKPAFHFTVHEGENECPPFELK